MGSIQSMLPKTATVMRDGKERSIPVSEIVRGDLIKLKYGSKIPADLRFVEVHGIKLDNSILTGEAMPVQATVDSTDDNINESRNIGLLGTFVVEGTGMGIVYATGDSTMMGRIATLAGKTEGKRTLLQIEIQQFVRLIAFLALTTGSICMLVWAFWLRQSHPGFLTLSNMLAVDMGGVIVAFVPNGLPVAVTLVLSIIAQRMKAQRVLAKNLNTVGEFNVNYGRSESH